MKNYVVHHFLKLSISILCILSVQKLMGQKCPPLIVPSLSYQIQGQLEYAMGAEVNLHFVPRGCNCNGPWGGLCYLSGPVAGLRAQYYPDIKGFDLTGSYGFRILLFKAEVVAGHTFVKEDIGKDFFHVGPSLGLDLFVGNLSVGYSFRNVQIEDKVGSFFLRIAVSPLALSNSSKARKVLSTYSKASRAEIKRIRASY